MRTSFLPQAALQEAKNCTATLKKCVARKWRFPAAFKKVALSCRFQESGAFLPLSCGFQAPVFRLPRLGPAECFFRSRRVAGYCAIPYPPIRGKTSRKGGAIGGQGGGDRSSGCPLHGGNRATWGQSQL